MRPGDGPFLAVEVEVDAPGIQRSRSRAELTQWVSLGAAFTLVLFCVLLFLAYRRAGVLEHRMLEQKRLAEMGEMGAVLAHEIRNPLGVIKGTAQVLAERAGEDKERKKLHMVVDQTQRLERLVNGLLDYTRPKSLKKEETEIRSLVKKACSLLEQQAVSKQVAILRDLEAGTAQVDPDALLQVLLNLLDNAIEAVEEGGTVTVKLRFKADRVVLSVLDDGPGIPADVRDRLFRPFVTSKVQGTGLGLPLSKQIAEAHGGTLTGETRGDGEGGARFVLMVPRSS